MNHHQITEATKPSPPKNIQHVPSLSRKHHGFGASHARKAPCQAFPWREASHPLLRRRTLRADGATVFGVHFGGHVLQLLSHHIVHGEVPVCGENGMRFTQD